MRNLVLNLLDNRSLPDWLQLHSINVLLFPNKVLVTANIILTKGRSYSVGTDIAIYCETTGEPAPEITWYKDNQLVEQSEHLQLPGDYN